METILHKRWLGLLLIVAMAAPVGAQPVGRMRGVFGPAAVKVDGREEKADENLSESAGLKTDPEAQQLLTRAEQFIQDERYDLAAVLMQKVLDDAGDNLVPIDDSGRLYISLRRQVEQRLAKLPKLALSTYRVTADGEAQALINGAKPDKEEEALSQVVRRFFMSSVGDDAAYKLGCMSLDRHDFIGASRMFSRILEEHPDPSMSQSDLLLRLSVAAARVGDRSGASKFLTELENASGPRPARALLSQVAEDIEESAGTVQLVSARLAMPPLPADATSKTLTELWSREFAMTFQEAAANRGGGMAYDQFGNPIVQQRAVSREQVISRWKQNGWMPAGKLQFGDGRVYFKTNDKVTAWSTEGKDKVVWESAWKNEYALDDFSQYMAMVAMNGGQAGGNDDRPRAPAEVLLFGDRVHQDFSIIGANLYNIEGRQVSGGANPPRPGKPFNWQTTPRRSRVNYLAAYDARTGKAKWHRSADEEVKEGTDGGLGFMAAPVACGTTLLLPVTDGGAMWLYGLSPDDGKTLWKTYLCDEPAGGCAPWSPVSIAVEGRDAYVLPGAGVVFAMDGTSGAIRWVVRYERQEKAGGGRMGRNMYGQPNRLKEYSGWSEDKLIASGRQLVVMGSDSDQLFCLDCRTGDKLWDSPRTLPGGQEVDYCVGLQGRQLVVAGKSQVRGYDIVSGKIKWEYPPRNKGKEESGLESYGRGVLTDDIAYIPVKDSVLKLNPADGSFMGQVGVRLSIPGEDPVGNLYSDGEKLWVLSANRVFALTHIEYRMQALEKRIKEGDAAALIDRFRLYSRDEAWDLAMGDLKAAYALLNTQKGPEEAVSAVFAAIDELKLASIRPTMTLETLTQLLGEASLKPDHRVKLDNVISVAISSMPRTKTGGVARSILAAMPIMKQDFLLQSAARVIKRVATPEDKAALQAAATGNAPPAALVAVEAWAMLDPESARPVLREQLAKAEGKAKLLLVRSLLQTGDREALGTLIDMLENDDLQTRIQTFQSLRGATGKTDLAFVSYAPAADRTRQIQAWKDWYAANKESVKLVLPLPESGTQLGRTLIASQSRNLIIELDAAGKEISRKQNIPQPWSVTGLPNGNRLVASTMNPFRVVEYDDQWKEVWVVDGLPAGSWSVDRAIDGATVIACADAGQVIEVKTGAAKEKRVLWSNTAGARPIFVKRLETGNTLICLQNMNKVIEIDGDGKQVWESPNFVNPFSAQRLENGNTLIAVMLNGANGSIVEVDRGGKTVKTHKQGLRQLYAAQKLESGNIMYIDNQGLHEIDADGKQVFDRREQGVMFTGFSKF